MSAEEGREFGGIGVTRGGNSLSGPPDQLRHHKMAANKRVFKYLPINDKRRPLRLRFSPFAVLRFTWPVPGSNNMREVHGPGLLVSSFG